MLCIALSVVFAGVSLSGALDAVQHAPGASIEHKHLVFSDFSIEQDHVDDHHLPASDDEGGTSDHLAGHHHHGDSGSGMAAAPTGDTMTLARVRGLHAVEPERQMSSMHTDGHERPPRRQTMIA